MNYCIITGTSKGLGEAIAYELMKKDVHLFSISRNKNENLEIYANKNGCSMDHFAFDLNDLNLIESLVHNIVEKIDFSIVNTLSLINNAGVLSPIMPADRCSSTEILQNFQVNTIAPIILTAQFIKQTENSNCKRTVVNISSGAGKKPYYGWSAYSSSKAAIDMYTRVVGLEQVNRDNPVKIFSFAPGVVDTEMQEKIRKTKAEDFDSVERFKAFKLDGKLLKPEFVAKKLIDLMNRSDLIQGGIYDIKEFF